jgi:hypothetical protein
MQNSRETSLVEVLLCLSVIIWNPIFVTLMIINMVDYYNIHLVISYGPFILAAISNAFVPIEYYDHENQNEFIMNCVLSIHGASVVIFSFIGLFGIERQIRLYSKYEELHVLIYMIMVIINVSMIISLSIYHIVKNRKQTIAKQKVD